MKWWITILLAGFSCAALAQQAEKSIQEGNQYYRAGQFDKAAAAYNKALRTDPQHATAKLNLANSMQKLGKDEEALQLYTEVATNTNTSADLKAKAYYNKGAVLSKQKKPEESIEAYKDALRIDPADKEARENLQKALLELKKKKQPEKKDDQQKKKKEQDQQKKQQQQPKISRKEAEQRLKLLEQKEKEVQQRLQKEKAKGGGGQAKDW